MIKFWLQNWKNVVGISALCWSAFGFLYILWGLPHRVEVLEEEVTAINIEKLPPRVGNLESNVKSLEKDMYQIKADLQENHRITLNTYQLVKEMRDSIVFEALRNGSKK